MGTSSCWNLLSMMPSQGKPCQEAEEKSPSPGETVIKLHLRQILVSRACKIPFLSQDFGFVSFVNDCRTSGYQSRPPPSVPLAVQQCDFRARKSTVRVGNAHVCGLTGTHAQAFFPHRILPTSLTRDPEGCTARCLPLEATGPLGSRPHLTNPFLESSR